MSERFPPAALAEIEPFNRLDPDEVATILGVAQERNYAPGERLYRASRPVTKVSIVLEGEVEGAAGRIVGALGALCGQSVVRDIRAGLNGARCLQVRRGQFFTIVHECPEILTWLLEQPSADPAGGLT